MNLSPGSNTKPLCGFRHALQHPTGVICLSLHVFLSENLPKWRFPKAPITVSMSLQASEAPNSNNCLPHKAFRHYQHVYWTVAKTWYFSTRDWQSCPLVKPKPSFCKLVPSHLPWFLWPNARVPILVQLRVFHFLFWSFYGIFKLFVFLVLRQPVAPCAYSQCQQGLIHTGSKAYLSCSFQWLVYPAKANKTPLQDVPLKSIIYNCPKCTLYLPYLQRLALHFQVAFLAI